MGVSVLDNFVIASNLGGSQVGQHTKSFDSDIELMRDLVYCCDQPEDEGVIMLKRSANRLSTKTSPK